MLWTIPITCRWLISKTDQTFEWKNTMVNEDYQMVGHLCAYTHDTSRRHVNESRESMSRRISSFCFRVDHHCGSPTKRTTSCITIYAHALRNAILWLFSQIPVSKFFKSAAFFPPPPPLSPSPSLPSHLHASSHLEDFQYRSINRKVANSQREKRSDIKIFHNWKPNCSL